MFWQNPKVRELNHIYLNSELHLEVWIRNEMELYMKFLFIKLYWGLEKNCSWIQFIWLTRIGELFSVLVFKIDYHERETKEIYFSNGFSLKI